MSVEKQENNTLFSIGIPAFKSAFLKQCIESVLNQTYPYFELIIINDCSPHPVDEIIHKFTDARIRYFKNDINIGSENVVDNWNKCVEHARGEFIVLMGDDDVMELTYLEEFLALIDRFPNLDVYHCRSKIIDGKGEALGLTSSWPEYEHVYDSIWHRLNEHRQQFISDFLYRTESLKRRGGFYKLPLAWGSDDISAYLACGNKGIAHTNNPVFQYRHHGTSISSTGSGELKMDAVLSQHIWFKNFLKTEPIDAVDKIQHKVLLKSINKLMQKKKTRVITESLSIGFFKGLLKWFKMRKKYQYSTIEFGYSVFECFKAKIVKSKF
ncbi:MAG: glycosyltransferase family 2 protein [Mucilaginibacter sp.]